MSIHTDKAFKVAQQKGAAAGRDYVHWQYLVKLPKRELIEVCFHLAALCTDRYDHAIERGGAFDRICDELDALRDNGLI